MKKISAPTLLAGVLLTASFAAPAANWYPYAAEQTEPAFSDTGVKKPIDYSPLPKAAKKWKLCVSFPHMKDAYWLGVDYGVVEEAKRLGVSAQILEAGGYTNLNKQISQIEDCVAGGGQAVVIGGISADGLVNLVKSLKAKNIPTVDVINGINSPDLTAKSLVSFYTMGQEAGAYLAKKHPAGSAKAVVAWFPGPAGAGWVEAANKGFAEAVKGSSLEVMAPIYGDTGKEVQAKLVEDALQSNPAIRYIAGTAVTAEVSQGIVRARNLKDKVQVISFYLTPDVYAGIEKGTIMASPADAMVIQGRIAVDQAVRALEGKDLIKHVGPKIVTIDKANLKQIRRDDVLPPASFKPLFEVK